MKEGIIFMANEVIFNPEINLIKENEYYLFYEMMMQSLRTDNVKEGINKSLELLRLFLQSDNVILFRKNEHGQYVFNVSDAPVDKHIKLLSNILNVAAYLTETKGIFNLEFSLSENLKNVQTIYLKNGDMECILTISNYDELKKLESLFWERVRETMQIILKRAASYEKNIKAISTDLLTGLDNRNAYEMRLQNLNEADSNLIFGIFDLFRLKFINDNYSHSVGDNYIKKSAQILNKYWPKYNSNISELGIETFTETGHVLYRVGGDEFILLTSAESIDVTNVKANLAKQEVCMIDLETSNHLLLGLNTGIVMHKPGDFIKNTYISADNIMQDDKKKMYLKYGIERRR